MQQRQEEEEEEASVLRAVRDYNDMAGGEEEAVVVMGAGGRFLLRRVLAPGALGGTRVSACLYVHICGMCGCESMRVCLQREGPALPARTSPSLCLLTDPPSIHSTTLQTPTLTRPTHHHPNKLPTMWGSTVAGCQWAAMPSMGTCGRPPRKWHG